MIQQKPSRWKVLPAREQRPEPVDIKPRNGGTTAPDAVEEMHGCGWGRGEEGYDGGVETFVDVVAVGVVQVADGICVFEGLDALG